MLVNKQKGMFLLVSCRNGRCLLSPMNASSSRSGHFWKRNSWRFGKLLHIPDSSHDPEVLILVSSMDISNFRKLGIFPILRTCKLLQNITSHISSHLPGRPPKSMSVVTDVTLGKHEMLSISLGL